MNKRAISWTNIFKRDFKREKKTDWQLENILNSILQDMANDIPLAPKYKDHAMTGVWQNSRDCHIKPDLVLIYKKPDSETLLLVRIGSHAQLEI